jgi:hypothetical protein
MTGAVFVQAPPAPGRVLTGRRASRRGPALPLVGMPLAIELRSLVQGPAGRGYAAEMSWLDIRSSRTKCANVTECEWSWNNMVLAVMNEYFSVYRF